MDKTVDLAEDLSHHVQCKIIPTVALLRMSLNLSSESVMKIFYLSAVNKKKQKYLFQLIARSIGRVRDPGSPRELMEISVKHCGPHQRWLAHLQWDDSRSWNRG